MQHGVHDVATPKHFFEESFFCFQQIWYLLPLPRLSTSFLHMEPYFYHTRANAGWVEVVCGSMFSGKTEELIRRLKRAKIAKQRVEIFKPALDTRYSDDAVVSHDETAIPSTPVHAVQPGLSRQLSRH